MKNKLSKITIICLFLGIICGLLFPTIINEISFIGTIYINMLKFMIIPLISTSIITTIYKSKNLKDKTIAKTILLFIIMFTLTFILTSIIILILKPGENYSLNIIKWEGESNNLKISEIITNLFPSNIINILQNNSMFSAIIFSAVFAIAATKVKDSESLINIIDKLKEVLYKILEYIMYITPVAVFVLIGSAASNYKIDIIFFGIKYILTAYLCSIVALIAIMIIPSCIFGKIKIRDYIKKVYKVWIISITTCSSVVTLPTTIKTCNEEFKIPEKITNLVVPLGTTIHMCGGAVSFALLGIFTSQLYNIDITIGLYLKMLISSIIINMAAPGIPSGGIAIGASYLTILNIPLEFMGIYSGIYKLLDMSYTTLNVTGDITANIILNNRIKNSKI